MADQINTPAQSLNFRLGSDLAFPIINNFTSISGVNLLIQDIQIALLTLPGERPHQPNFGCLLRNQIWENIETAAQSGIGIITRCLETFEPRITLLGVSIAEINRNTDLIIYKISFLVNNTDTQVNLVFPLRTGADISNSI